MGAPSVWRRTPHRPEDYFSPHELDRSRRYQGPLARLRMVRGAIGLVATLLFVVLEAGPKLIARVGVDNWVLQLMVIMVALDLLALLWDPALDWWVDMVHDKKWEISRQTATGFAADQAKSFALGLVMNSVLLIPLYAIVRTTSWWWLIGWLLSAVFVVGLGFLYPVLIAPIFNRFEPLEAGELADRLVAVAERAAVPIEGAFVADESRRSTRDNAYVAGYGATRRVVLYDTLLEHPPQVVEQVVAHEIGHVRRRHLHRQLPAMALMLLMGFGALRLVAGWDGLFEAVGVDGVRDPASLPIAGITVGAVFSVAGLAMAWLSRAFEREADLEALDLLGRPDLMADMLKRLHTKNLADLDPSLFTRIRMSHPAAAERLAFTGAWTPAPGSK
ncbi:MAG: M48 family metallopeptidase [Actinomycetia bacterium]|nr:M48 family metallopeptidase [Actinomycetes bacterium]